MKLNSIQPAKGSKHSKRRVGRGIGSGLGKTAGRGHKGQKSRAGGFHKVGFEGGQMPLSRRLPKYGFTSINKKLTGQVTLSDLQSLNIKEIDLDVLKQHNLVSRFAKKVKIINTGKISKPFIIRHGLYPTASAKLIIESAGGHFQQD